MKITTNIDNQKRILSFASEFSIQVSNSGDCSGFSVIKSD